MKVKKTSFIVITCSILSLFSCNKIEEPAAAFFIIEDVDLKFDAPQTSGSKRITVKTNIDWDKALTITSDQEWCKATKDSREETTILLTYEKSDEVDIRNATITVENSAQNYTITVRQLGLGPAILVSSSASTIGADGGSVDITVTANVEYTSSKSDGSEWFTLADTGSGTKGLIETASRWEAVPNPMYEDRTVKLIYKQTNGSVEGSCEILQEEIASSSDDVEVPSDELIVPTSGWASEAQEGAGIENSFDGKFQSDGGNAYHSVWSQSAKFPVTLKYYFDQKPDLDYLIYHTRSGNGNFGKLKIYTATEASPEYALLGDSDFKMQNAPSKVTFPAGLKKVTKIKFEVTSGSGNFVSCDEMQFFKKNTGDGALETQLLGVFTDIVCDNLRSDVTMEKIHALPSYFAKLATTLKNNTYDPFEKSFRVRDYKAYSDTEDWAETLMTKKYTNLDNCTGIYANAGETIIVLVGNTGGTDINLQSIKDFETSGDTYMLSEGVNKITVKNTGMLFLMYQTTLPANPIKVHIPINSGTVNGFFDLEEHKTDAKYVELLSKATYKYFFIRGEKIIFYFHLDQLRVDVPNGILSAINLWDEFVSWQHELMGVDNFIPNQMNNHVFAISPEDNETYMWASDYQIAFGRKFIYKILDRDVVMSAVDNAWGPAHELGHVNQKAINWPSSTESSNNLFSNFTMFKLDKYCSRGSELSKLATSRFVNKEPWALMENADGGEDTELHMRMNWQLWNYFHRCGHKPTFWPELFKELRSNRIVESNPGEGQMKFAEMACKVANQNLTEFFEMWGFFEPVNQKVEQYGEFDYLVTQEMITATKDAIRIRNYPDMTHPIQYLEDRRSGDLGIGNYKVGDVGYYTQFVGEGTKITKSLTYTLSNRRINITNGEEAVAFEIEKDNKLIFFFNFLSFEIPAEIPLDDIKLYAVQSDGKKKEIVKN